jgi:choline monooxygenase
MPSSLVELIDRYNPDLPLSRASTIPASWYLDPRILDLERRTVFSRSWQFAARTDQVRTPGHYVACEVAGEPVVIVRGEDDMVRSFFNVCRHHAAAVVTEAEGLARTFRCPYHGWTYGLDGALKGTPDFTEVCDFDRSEHGLVPVDRGDWEKWMFVCLERTGQTLDDFLGSHLKRSVRELGLENLHWAERRHYTLDCNWKVFVDNYLDGGYHVPHVHKGLDSVLDYAEYKIENGPHFVLQSSPIVGSGGSKKTNASDIHRRTQAVRQGERASYYWIYPNFMINWYAGAMDTNLVIPRAVDKTDVIFDFYFADVSRRARARNRASIDISQHIQDEDVAICTSVQRGLASRAYSAGRLSVRRESGEHLFHRLLHADLKAGLTED